MLQLFIFNWKIISLPGTADMYLYMIMNICYCELYTQSCISIYGITLQCVSMHVCACVYACTCGMLLEAIVSIIHSIFFMFSDSVKCYVAVTVVLSKMQRCHKLHMYSDNHGAISLGNMYTTYELVLSRSFPKCTPSVINKTLWVPNQLPSPICGTKHTHVSCSDEICQQSNSW